MHAAEIAARLEIGTVLVPRHAGVLSALGMLVADVTRDYSASVLDRTNRLRARALEAATAPLVSRARRELRFEGFAGARVRIERLVDVRYVGQSYEITVPISTDFRSAFDRRHEQLYGYANPDRAAEVVAVRVRATGLTTKPSLPSTRIRRRTVPRPAALRAARFDGRDVRTSYCRWDACPPGSYARGPAIITGGEATIVVPPRLAVQRRRTWECTDPCRH